MEVNTNAEAQPLVEKKVMSVNGYKIVIFSCVAAIFLLSALLTFFVLKDVQQEARTEYAKNKDVLLNRVALDKSGGGSIQIYNCREERIDISGYILCQISLKTATLRIPENTVLDPLGKYSLSVPEGTYDINGGSIVLQDPAGRQYFDIFSIDCEQFKYQEQIEFLRDPDGGEWLIYFKNLI